MDKYSRQLAVDFYFPEYGCGRFAVKVTDQMTSAIIGRPWIIV